VKKIAVLGAGKMGAGIAYVAAYNGFDVILRDLQMALVKEGLKQIEEYIRRDPSHIEEKIIMGRIQGTTDLADVQEVDLVIEAAVENLTIKKQIFSVLDNICADHTILATNTSTLSISQIAACTKKRDKIIGMHFFAPVPAVNLVELVRGMETSWEVVDKCKEFIVNLHKHPVVLNRESPGFIVNRLMVPYINEAIFILAEGIASKEDIDQAMKLGAGMPVGPLELADLIGLDSLLDITEVFFNEFKDPKYRPHPLLATMIRAGYLGKKTGQGFYLYE